MYRAPVRELRFVLHELLQVQRLAQLPAFNEYSPDLADSVLEEAARFAQEVLDPLNRPGDVEGARWTPEGVRTAAGFREAFAQFVAGGWTQLGAPAEYGGQPAPLPLLTAVQELWGSACLSFKLCPMLTHGAVHALELCGSPEQKQRFLPKMINGEWTGTMVLTEPHSGSDLSLVRTRAAREGEHYRIFGQKIFITWGEHDLTANTIHMVLARIEGAPPGVRGISLFIVPRMLVNEDGSVGERNDVRCVSIEHKLGIRASPTCVLAFGEGPGALGYLVGEANRGLEYMFVMMNTARLSVGVEGYAIGERAFQRAAEWARTRLQGRGGGAGSSPVPIVNHPDVKRMLLTMRASTEASRALALYAALELDLAAHAPDAAARAAAQARGDLLIPIVKGWCTEIGNEMAGLGVQVHGGMGFIEETGAAQYVRDVRITTIYEGTTGIQANDLLGRKITRDGGAAIRSLLAQMAQELQLQMKGPEAAIARSAFEALTGLGSATSALLELAALSPEAAQAVAVPYLKLCGYVLGAWLMVRAAAMAAQAGAADREFYAAKRQTARFFVEQLLPRALGLAAVIEKGAGSVSEADPALI